MKTIPQEGLPIPVQSGMYNLRELGRTLVETTVNGIMDAQADMFCEEDGTTRNGYRERKLTTCVGVNPPGFDGQLCF